MMKEINFVSIILMMIVFKIDTARVPVAGNFNPLFEDNPSILTNYTLLNVDQSSEIKCSNKTRLENMGPSLDLIDSHFHSHDDDNTSAIETVNRLLIQPSIDFLDSQIHGGEKHVHRHKNSMDKETANLNDFQQWLREQSHTNQLARFLLLQKEVNRLNLVDTQELKNRLNRTIEEIKSSVQGRRRTKHDL